MVYNIVRMVKKLQREIGNLKAHGYPEGIMDGKIQGKLEVAEKLFSMRMDINAVAECTGLPMEELQSVKSKVYI